MAGESAWLAESPEPGREMYGLVLSSYFGNQLFDLYELCVDHSALGLGSNKRMSSK